MFWSRWRWSVLLCAFCIPAAALDSRQVAAWETDLDFLLAEFPKKEGGFTPDERAAFEAQIASVRSGLASMDEEHVIVGVMQAVAHARNGHTGANPPRGDVRYGRVPIRLWYFADGPYVVKARPEFAHLLGAKLVSVGGHEVGGVIERVSTLGYGNRSWNKHVPSIRITVPALLYGLDLIPEKDRAEFGFEKADGLAVQETLAAEAPDTSKRYYLAIWDLAPASEIEDTNWRYAYADTSDKAPLYLRDPNQVLWYEYVKKLKLLYIQYNSSVFEDGDDRKALIEGMLEAVSKKKPEKVVVDLRLNGGGDLTQMRGAFNRMLRDERLQEPGRLYVITGQGTFSAGLFHAANLKEQGATVVGELVGDDLDFWAEGGAPFELPNSKMRINVSTGFHSYSKIAYPQYKEQLYLNLDIDTLEPDIPIEMTFDDYVNGRDPVLDAAVAD
jgi:hypothetical protein